MTTKVVILCGGMGTRLKEETEYRPKPMVQIGGRPILWHIMNIFASHGLKEFVLCLGYKGEMIKEYFQNFGIHNNDFTIKMSHPQDITYHSDNTIDWTITLADTGAASLKGARLKKIEKYIDDDIFLTSYGDSLGNIDVSSLIDFHKRHGKIATITGINPTSRFGEIKFKGDKVISFREKPKSLKTLVNGGFMVFRKEIFNYLTDADTCDLEYGPLEKLARDGQLMIFKHEGFWACMDTIRDMEYLNELWNSNNAGWVLH
ncbi:MAG: glucose-1-phosphate cytidylyltransferase [Proteobacteria bacterium]|nr:glucose-1-phosphate cytidylyltransferase [Desulfobacula sp.]MBU3953500.1 glucose-1-phosphate cytidylyltransferase [Pseudomonadota bacterium]MBU4133592.1 glucose-1-phosphate cytidylyltransferase [Pseudomonadota bacterium]